MITSTKKTMKKGIIMIGILLIISGCQTVDLNDAGQTSTAKGAETSAFKGEVGTAISIENDGVTLDAESVSDGIAHFYNTTIPNGDTVYFFIVKSPDGKLRAAANGCQVCGDALQGFHQDRETMVCNTCGNRYPLDKIATEKGGCNPAPINPDLKVENGSVFIPVEDLVAINQYFK